MAEFVYVNGEFIPKEQATISLFDHGYLYGDGVFEGVRVYGGKVFELAPHVQRLLAGARALGFPLGELDEAKASDAILATCRKNDHQNGYIRVNLTRGTGLGLDPKHLEPKVNFVVATRQLALYPPELYEQGLSMITCSTRVPSPDAIDTRIKCTGKYINNILAKMEANRVGAGEGIMLNQQGYVAEATGDNVFILTRDGVFVTPPPSAGCLKGITRGVAIKLLKEQFGHTVAEQNLTLFDLYSAQECFLTGTAAEIIPAVSLDERLIGDGKPGPHTAALVAAFRTYTQTTGTAF
jgi:branched-chain amino acid aminotransferase